MKQKVKFDADFARAGNDPLDLDALLHPALAFTHPLEVVRDPDLTLNEKRAILASWASDACAVEASPALRRPPGGQTVAFDDIIDALRSLDKEEDERQKQRPHYREVLAKRMPGVFGRKSRERSPGDRGQAVN